MTQEELKNLEIAKLVDSRGTACPGPLLAAKKSLGDIDSGEVMEIQSSDEGTKKDIPKWANKKGHEFLGVIDKDSFSRLFMRKG